MKISLQKTCKCKKMELLVLRVIYHSGLFTSVAVPKRVARLETWLSSVVYSEEEEGERNHVQEQNEFFTDRALITILF